MIYHNNILSMAISVLVGREITMPDEIAAYGYYGKQPKLDKAGNLISAVFMALFFLAVMFVVMSFLKG